MQRPIDAFAKHVELLRPLLSAGQPMSVTPQSADMTERILWRELKESGFIDCVYRCDEKGVPSDFVNITITSRGRALIAEFDSVLEPEKKKTDWKMISALVALAGLAILVLRALPEILPSH